MKPSSSIMVSEGLLGFSIIAKREVILTAYKFLFFLLKFLNTHFFG